MSKKIETPEVVETPVDETKKRTRTTKTTEDRKAEINAKIQYHKDCIASLEIKLADLEKPKKPSVRANLNTLIRIITEVKGITTLTELLTQPVEGDDPNEARKQLLIKYCIDNNINTNPAKK